MASLLSKEKRTIYLRRISQFWEEYRSKRIGMLGLVLIILYAGIAVFAPLLTPYSPVRQGRLAQAFAMPSWVTIFPPFADYGRTQEITLNWNAEEGSQFVTGGWGTSVGIQYEAEHMQLVKVELGANFSFTDRCPNEFYQRFTYEATNISNVEYALSMKLHAPDGEEYLFWRSDALDVEKSQLVSADSKDPLFIERLGFELQQNVGNAIFSEKGSYYFTLVIQFRPLSKSAAAHVEIKDCKLVILGRVHGILGTDYLAKDIWTHLLYGARISLIVGLLAAVVGTSIGLLVGVISGYIGGITDEALMRVVDILLCLPLLPLLLALIHQYGRNVYYIVVFIAIFGWQGLSRIIRSQTLSIRETPYIESARASGASGFYIMRRHIVPNIVPVAFASMILAVPSAILFEAALSFLGFGDPRVITWGMMLQHAFGFGGFSFLAWWWIIPPGLAIIGICLAFVFVGHAFDEIVNPRLRRRR